MNGKTKAFGLLAHPVEHSMSPQLHGFFYEETGFNGVYIPFDVPPDQVEGALEGLKSLGLKGVNVTIPHKQAVMPFLDRIDEKAQLIGAVNTIKVDNQALIGYNTDWVGLKMACDHEGIPIQGQQVMILGAGGAARAVAMMAAVAGAKTIVVLNRTLEKAQALLTLIEDIDPDIDTQAGTLAGWKHASGSYVVVQTTSIGMWPETDKAVITDPGFYDQVDYLVDLIYNPAKTYMMTQAEEKGIPVMNGLKMLYYQGLESFRIWTDQSLSKIQIERSFLKLKQLV